MKDKLQNTIHGTGSLVASRKFSSEVKIQIKSIDRWGSCHTEHDEGYVNIQNYKCSLNLTKALNFEMYRQNAHERYRIKYIRVDVELNQYYHSVYVYIVTIQFTCVTLHIVLKM